MGVETGTALLIASILTAATVTGTTIASGRQAKKGRAAAAEEAEKGRAAFGAAAKPATAPETTISKLAKKSPSRLALIATSPRGVLGPASVGRRKILGN